MKTTREIPGWFDRATRALVEDIIGLLAERHPDLLAVSTIAADMRSLIKKLYASQGYTITRPVPVV